MQNPSPSTKQYPFVIAIVGEKAAGKGEVAKILEQMIGAYRMRYSDPIRIAHIEESGGSPGKTLDADMLAEYTAAFLQKNTSHRTDAFTDRFYQEIGIKPPSTFELQDIANRLRAKFGAGFFTEILLRTATLLNKQSIIIDGVRNPGELEPLKERASGRYVLLGVIAGLDIRKKRFLDGRQRIGDPKTEKDFLLLEARDKGIGEPTDGQQVAKCLTMVEDENMITNNSTMQELESKIITWFEDCKKQKR